MHPLQARLRTTASRARRLMIMTGVARFLTMVTAAVLVACFSDYVLRFQDVGVRSVITSLVVVVAAWCAMRFFHPAWSWSADDVEIARRVESRFPQLQDRLSSAVAFLNQSTDDPTAGSVRLRQSVVAQVMGETTDVEFTDCLDSSRAKSSLTIAGLSLGCALLLCAVDPSSASFAASRLFTPWVQTHWPRVNELVFANSPTKIGLGADLELELLDRNGDPPTDATLHIWRDGDSQPSTRVMRFAGERVVGRINNIVGKLRYRATGGDDSTMPWHSLDVVEPPQLSGIETRVQPPAYSGLPVTSSAGEIELLLGSQVLLVGACDQPLQRVVLRFEAAAAKEVEYEQPPAVHISEQRKTYSVPASPATPWRPVLDGKYWIEFTDSRDVFGMSPKWTVRVRPDRPPEVRFDSQQVNHYVTIQARVRVEATVVDDLALRHIVLKHRPADQPEGSEKETTLYEGGATPPRFASGQPPGEQRAVSYEFDLTKVAGLAPGDVLVYRLAAADYLPQEGASGERRLTIVSREELADRVEQRQSFVLGRLAEALRMQRETRAHVKSLEIQLEQTASLRRADSHQLQATELAQRKIGRILSGEKDSALELIEQLLDDIQRNRLDSPEATRRMRDVHAAVQQLVRGPLPAIQRRLLLVGRQTAAALDAKPDDAVAPLSTAHRQALTDAGTDQEVVIDKLEELLGELNQWENYRRFAREVHRVRRDQEDVSEQTASQRLRTLGKPFENLDDQEKASLLRLSQQQLDLARRFERLQSQMGKTSEQLKDANPVASDTLAEGVNTARRAAVSGQMRESARNLGANRIGQSLAQQAQTQEALSELLSVLSNRRETELQRQLKKMREEAQQMKTLRAQQAVLRSKFQQAAEETDEAKKRRELERLTRQQQSLAQQTQDTARRLQRLQAQRTSAATQRAAGSMAAAAQAGQQGDAGQAADHAEQAERALEEAEQQLGAEMQQAQQDLLNEQLARLAQTLEGLRSRQAALLEVTNEFAPLAAENLGDDQRATLRAMSLQQLDLLRETTELSESLTGAEAFQLALRGAAQSMSRAAAQLGEFSAGASIAPQELALSRLDQVREALKPPSPEDRGEPQQQQQPKQQGQPGQPPTDGVHALAEIRLVKLLQEEINQRTLELSKRSAQTPLNDEQQAQLDQLSEEQGQLADLLLNLIQQSKEDAANQIDEPVEPGGEEPPATLEEELLKSLESEMSTSTRDPAERFSLMKRVWISAAIAIMPLSGVVADDGVGDLEKQLLGDLEKELLEGLDGKPADSRKGEPSKAAAPGGAVADEGETDPLTQIASQMREVERLIAEAQTAGKTQQLQTKIVADLQSLLVQLQKQQQQQRQQRQKQAGGGDKQPGDQQQNSPSNKPARDSSTRLDRPEETKLDVGEIANLIKEVWGQLPERASQRMPQVTIDRFLPKYESMIEEYFRRLAEEDELR